MSESSTYIKRNGYITNVAGILEPSVEKEDIMYQLKLIGMLLALLFGVIGISISSIVLIRHRLSGIKIFSLPKRFIVKNTIFFMIAVFMTLSSLFWLINFHPFDRYPYSSTLKDAISFYGRNRDYQVISRIDTELSAIPIIFAIEEDELFVYTILTKKTLFGLEKYYINGYVVIIGEIPLPPYDGSFGAINETLVYDIPEFPDILFGVAYPDKRDRIQICGEVPAFYEIRFNETDYIFWYIKRNGENTITDLVF